VFHRTLRHARGWPPGMRRMRPGTASQAGGRGTVARQTGVGRRPALRLPGAGSGIRLHRGFALRQQTLERVDQVQCLRGARERVAPGSQPGRTIRQREPADTGMVLVDQAQILAPGAFARRVRSQADGLRGAGRGEADQPDPGQHQQAGREVEALIQVGLDPGEDLFARRQHAGDPLAPGGRHQGFGKRRRKGIWDHRKGGAGERRGLGAAAAGSISPQDEPARRCSIAGRGPSVQHRQPQDQQ
jgi:hypothetical protein